MRSGPELTVRLHGGKSECESRGPAVWLGDGDRFRGYDPIEASATTASAPTEARARASTSTKDQGVFPTESGYAAGGDGGQRTNKRIDMQYPGSCCRLLAWGSGRGLNAYKGISVGL